MIDPRLPIDAPAALERGLARRRAEDVDVVGLRELLPELSNLSV